MSIEEFDARLSRPLVMMPVGMVADLTVDMIAVDGHGR
jgi:hypothetical protein